MRRAASGVLFSAAAAAGIYRCVQDGRTEYAQTRPAVAEVLQHDGD